MFHACRHHVLRLTDQIVKRIETRAYHERREFSAGGDFFFWKLRYYQLRREFSTAAVFTNMSEKMSGQRIGIDLKLERTHKGVEYASSVRLSSSR